MEFVALGIFGNESWALQCELPRAPDSDLDRGSLQSLTLFSPRASLEDKNGNFWRRKPQPDSSELFHDHSIKHSPQQLLELGQ